MANTYESKFKGVEVDEGVNIARNLTGTGGIEVKKTETGTINATVTIDGSGVKITPVSGTGTSTTDVMSQKAVTDELGKKQDTITNQTSLNVGGLNVNGTITGKDLSMTGNVNIEGVQVSITGETITFDSAHDDITFKSRYNAPVVFDVAAQFKGPSGAMFYLGDTGEYVKLMPAMNGTGIYDVRLPDTGGTLALTSDIPTGGGGSAGVSSIGGKTGAILLGTGLTIGSNNVLDVVTHMYYVNMYLHRIIGQFDRSSGRYMIMISFYDGTEAEFTGDTLGNLIQQLFEYQYTSSIVIAKTDGTATNWDPTKFEQLYVGIIVDDALYCNFNEMNIVPVSLYDIPFVSDIVEQLALPVS